MTWWESWFGEEYLDLYPHRDLDSARREVAFALDRLRPDPTPMLDLCCGAGRHLPVFLELGIDPIGLDYSAPLLELARARTARLRLVRADMRWLPFSDRVFQSVVNFFTSFGYFVGEADNAAVVSEIARVLAPGGRVLCDTFGLDHVLGRLVPEENRSGAGREYRIRRWWNPDTRRIEKEIEVRHGASTATFRESVRAYTAPELTSLFERAALRVEATWGDFDGSPVGCDSPRLILVACKP
ncbi:MAG: methyltransferase domain-containing protein [Thermoanaerobaculia bacterium]